MPVMWHHDKYRTSSKAGSASSTPGDGISTPLNTFKFFVFKTCFACYLALDYLRKSCLHIACILPGYCLRIACVSPEYCLHIACVFPACCLPIASSFLLRVQKQSEAPRADSRIEPWALTDHRCCDVSFSPSHPLTHYTTLLFSIMWR